MSRSLAVVLCGLLFLAVGCRKEGTTVTDTSASATTTTTTNPPANSANVEIHILGTAALIEQPDPKKPVAVILPQVTPSTPAEHPHVAYVAWHAENEDGPVPGSFIARHDSIDNSDWHVHPLANEEIVIANDLSANPAMLVPASGPCNPDFQHKGVGGPGCVAPVSDFLAAPAPYDSTFVDKITSNPRVLGRLDITNGTLVPYVIDECKWAITRVGAPQASRQHLASDIGYQFQIADPHLTVKLRSLKSKPEQTTDLVNLKPIQGRGIEVRFGNAVDIFPDKDHLIPADARDEHFATYYDVLYGVSAKGRPVPVRTKDCNGHAFDPTVYCGPGWVRGVGPKKPGS
jgi:hypothetical protein